MARNYQKGLYKDYELLLSKNEALEIKIALLREKNNMLKVIEAANEKL